MVLPDSIRITRVRTYSGNNNTNKITLRYRTLTLYCQASQLILLIKIFYTGTNSLPLYYSYNTIKQKAICTVFMVWTDPISLVTTKGISYLIYFPLLLRYFSSQCLRLYFRQYELLILGSPIRKSWCNNVFYQLHQAYRRFIRPSSDIQVKASTLCYK